MNPALITRRAGVAETRLNGHRATINPIPRRHPVRCGECPVCRSDLAYIVPCQAVQP